MAFGKLVQAGLMTGLLVSSAAHAQTALRAPLNIVPPIMQSAIGAPKARDRKGEKLAPRATARQMKRSVRAVAAAPGSASDIVQVGQLGALQDAPVGLEVGFGQEQGSEQGLEQGLWRGARLAFIADQMARLPTRFTTSVLRDAELTLHRGTAAAPVGTVDGISWFGARLNRFLALGDTQAVLGLEALTGAASSDAYAARATVLAHLGTGNPEAACEVTRPQRSTLGRRDTLRFFVQLGIYCQLREREYEKASLTMDLNQKTMGADRLFRDMAFLLAAQVPLTFGTSEQAAAAKKAKEEPPLVLPSELTPLQIAALQLAGEPLPEALPSVPAYYGGALVRDYSQTARVQLLVAHAAVLSGHMPAEQFSQVTQLADLSSFAPLAPAEAENSDFSSGFGKIEEVDESLETEEAPTEPSVEALPDAIYLAQTLLTIDAAPPQNQARTLAEALREASARGLWRDLVLMLDDRLRDLSIPLDDAEGLSDEGLELADSVQPEEPQAVALEPEFVTDTDIAVLLPALRYVGQFEKAEKLAGEQVVGLVTKRVLSFQRPSAAAILKAEEALANRARRMEALLAELETELEAEPESELEVAPVEALLGEPAVAASVEQLFASMQPLETPKETPIKTDVEPSDTSSPEIELISEPRLPPILDWEAFEMQWASADVPFRTFLRRELAIYYGLGAELPSALLDILALPELNNEQLRLKKLADNKWIGDFLLAVVASYGEVEPRNLQAQEVVLLLQGFRHIGLSAVADDLASEFFTRASARLSVVSPQAFGTQAPRPVLFTPEEALPPPASQ
tara:strand:+ start:2926 stop:5322 length:2397 start_codon:yes stop_codon:yes gene_type:complete